MGRSAANIAGDLVFDTTLDTIPNASDDAADGLEGEEIAINAVKNVAENLGYNMLHEGLGTLFQAAADGAARHLDDVGQGGANVLDEVRRIDEIKVEFNYNLKYDESEFARQLADQEKGMNGLTVQEYLDNRQRYIEQGRTTESNAAQQVIREKAFVDKVDELQDAGLSLKEAEIKVLILRLGHNGVIGLMQLMKKYKNWQRICLKRRENQYILMLV